MNSITVVLDRLDVCCHTAAARDVLDNQPITQDGFDHGRYFDSLQKAFDDWSKRT